MNLTRRPSPPRGASILGLIVAAVIVGFLALMALRAFPSVNEYFTVRKVLGQILRGNPASADEIRRSFQKSIEIEYAIHTISEKDLVIKPQGDDRLRVSVAWNEEIAIVEPVYLLVKYEYVGTTGGSAP